MTTISAKVIEDSVSEAGARLTTLQLTFPRIILPEFNTHRVFSRNASSSRAIPVARCVDMALEDPFVPVRFGLNQPGMQAKDENLPEAAAIRALEVWEEMMDACARGVRELGQLGVHKQWANRPLEWFSHSHVVLTATEFDNWTSLRLHKDAQPEIYELANQIGRARNQSVPRLLKLGEWHLPYILEEERDGRFDLFQLKAMSSARCARVSYKLHDGTNPTPEKDLALFHDLVGSDPMHASPVEHQATPYHFNAWTKETKNFKGWIPFRTELEL